MKCLAYDDSLESLWDDFILNISWNGAFLHTRKFLLYHGDRFNDRSFLVFNENEKIIAVFPAAEDLSDPKVVVSHPGITYGGLVAGVICRGETCVNSLLQLERCYAALGYHKLIYKVVPNIYQKKLFQDDLYALFRVGAKRWRCDLSATIDLAHRGKLTKGRKYEINKARKQDFEIASGKDLAFGIYGVIEDNLQKKYGVKPVHTFNELLDLHSRFPDNIKFMAIKEDAEVLAGLVLFYFDNVVHTQYIASNSRAHDFGALDLLIEEAINEAGQMGFRYFDFGISNENDGYVLNENLYRYKRSFGAGSMVHEFYEIDLRDI